MLFFQTALLAGYAYAHVVISRLKPVSQIPVHLLVILLPLAVLPVGIGATWKPPVEGNPVAWLMMMMVVSVGMPFFAISTTASVMQKWFSQSGDKSAGDPYFLYVASNAGGIAGLIGYIVIVEPNLTLAQQSRVWSIGYGVLILLTAACALFLATHSRRAPTVAVSSAAAQDTDLPPIPLAQQLRWVALAFVPSSLMLGVTTFITADICAVPLLWVIPLTIYLLTFLLAYSRRRLIPDSLLLLLLPVIVVFTLAVLFWVPGVPAWVPLVIHILMFFVAALACHSQLARSRPHPRYLTGYYFLIAVGGALGGVFNVIVAPLVFKSPTEYDIALILACMLCTRQKPNATTKQAANLSFNRSDILLPLGLGVLTAALLLGARHYSPLGARSSTLLVMVLAATLCLAFIKRPVRLGLGLGALVLANGLFFGRIGPPVHHERNFFGILHVTTEPGRPIRVFVNGTTVHGLQSTLPERRRVPLGYHFPTGPIGQLLQRFIGKRVAVLGLGAGALAAYAERGQTFTFYEIDPASKRIASDPHYFTYLADARARGADVRVVLGDGRLSIARAPDKAFDLIVLDAFSGDAIPVHLLTRQAFRIYLSKLSPNGLIAVDISNEFVDVAPVVGDLAGDAGLVCLSQNDASVTPEESDYGKYSSYWAILARRESDLGSFCRDPRWQHVAARPGARVWTDDYSNLLQVLKWR